MTLLAQRSWLSLYEMDSSIKFDREIEQTG